MISLKYVVSVAISINMCACFTSHPIGVLFLMAQVVEVRYSTLEARDVIIKRLASLGWYAGILTILSSFSTV